MKKIIVIGGAGFIGTNLCLSALKKGLKVVIFDNLSRRGTEINIDTIFSNGPKENIEFIKGDIRNFEEVKKLFEQHNDADAIFHLAAQVAVTTSILNPREDFEINLLGTFNILEAMRELKISSALLFSSTNKVYGKMSNINLVEEKNRYKYRDFDGITEEAALDFYSPYGCSNGAADQYVLDYSRIFGLNTIVFRQSCIYGIHQFGIEDQGWVAWFAIASMFKKPITIYGNGKQVRDILFIDDLVEAYWAAVENIERTRGQAYNIGGGKEFQMSLLELLEKLTKLTKQDIPLSYDKQRAGDQLIFISNSSKALMDFGWKPKVSCEEGVEKLFNWIQDNQDKFKKLNVF